MSGINNEPRASQGQIDTYLKQKGLADDFRRTKIVQDICSKCDEDQSGQIELELFSRVYVDILNLLGDKKKEFEAVLNQKPAQATPSSKEDFDEAESNLKGMTLVIQTMRQPFDFLKVVEDEEQPTQEQAQTVQSAKNQRELDGQNARRGRTEQVSGCCIVQ